MTHQTTEAFWQRFERLPPDVQRLARKNYRLLVADPKHPSLRYKKLRGLRPPLWSIRIGLDYRALAYDDSGVMTWFWIGSHAEYDRVVSL